MEEISYMKFSKLKDIIQTHPNPTSLSIKSCNGYRLDVYAPGHICNIWSGNSFDSLVCQLVFYRAIEVKDYVELYLIILKVARKLGWVQIAKTYPFAPAPKVIVRLYQQ